MVADKNNMNDAANNDWLLELFVDIPAVVTPAPAVKKPAKKVCKRCGGTGRLPQYAHVGGGACFACTGAGKFTAEAKILKKQEHLTKND